MTFWLAPLHGITIYHFRNCLWRHTQEIKTAITPFLSIQPASQLNIKKWKDILPEYNHGMEIIPQLIGNNADYFLDTINALSQLGYTHFNWNLGCPMNAIVRKKRGCGLMPYPEQIEKVVQLVTQKTSFQLSLKMRLGMYQCSESEEIIKRMNHYPLAYIVLHPRLGTQQYEGTPNLDAFSERLEQSVHPLIYSGDIATLSFFKQLKTRFPFLQTWLLGRGVIQNPFLADQLNANNVTVAADEPPYHKRFILFYKDIVDTFLNHKNDKGALANLKELWHYFSIAFQLPNEEKKNLFRINELSTFLDKSEKIITTYKNIYY